MIQNLYYTLAVMAVLVFFYMAMWFAVAMFLKRNDIVDVAWGIGIVLVTFVSLWLFGQPTIQQVIIASLVALWGVRLSVYIFIRNHGSAVGEDPRYAAWRREWGRWFIPRTFGQVFMLQGALLLLVSMPMLVLNTYATSIDMLYINYVGIAIWAIGMAIETVADFQLWSFKNNQSMAGAILQSGLWRYSRHPNYFGEMLLWWGVWLAVYGTPFSSVALIGPITITILLTGVSGVPMTERRMRLKPGFSEYAARTSVYIPWFPKA